jgi:hypothetical protein
LQANPILLGWRRLIDTAVAGAKKIKHGLPTDTAIMDRWWIALNRPSEKDKAAWSVSFECACHFLGIDADAERKKLVAEINDVWSKAAVKRAADDTYRRFAMVMACTGRPTRLGKQYMLGLVSLQDYEEIAGVIHPDPPTREKRPRLEGVNRSRQPGGSH